MADGSDIDAALCALLWNDAQLRALMPDGVHMDSAGLSPTTGKNPTRFVLVSVFEAFDVGVFGKRGFEDALYLIQAVALVQAPESGTPTGDVKAAAARIEALLEDQPLTVAGYTWMTTHRERRHRTQEVDSADATIKWNHRGGFYRVQMTAG
jgi:hypothetical protein